MDDQLVQQAINSTVNAPLAFCKFLSANDSGETKSHQSGILIATSAKKLMFTDAEIRASDKAQKNIKIRWQNDIVTDSCFHWYESKHEFRLTRFGNSFPFLGPDYTGALFILIKNGEEDYDGYLLNTEEEINQYLDAIGLTPAETNRLIELKGTETANNEEMATSEYIASLDVDFPTSEEMSAAARNIYMKRFHGTASDIPMIKKDPDGILLDWTEEEYKLFRALERTRYGKIVSEGFSTVDDFVAIANQVLNRRKSRAGKSLEHHLSAIFDANKIQYTAQGVTEGNKKPDFVFPSIEAYHDMLFSVENLCTLAAKTTCKDRWRQVLNEADRLRDENKYLCTLQQGISSAQLDEMHAEKVILVVPKQYISSYPRDHQKNIWTVSHFIGYVREMEGIDG